MANRILTDEEVEAEIQRLNDSKYVRLARKVNRLKYARRQYLYTLRALEKQGRKLAEAGADESALDYAQEYYEDLTYARA